VRTKSTSSSAVTSDPGRPHHERLGQLARLDVGDADDGDVGHARVGHEERLELGRRDLEALELDELLHPVDDREVAVLVEATDVAGVEPAVLVDRVGRGLGVAQVALHDLGPTDEQLALPALGDVGALGIDDAALRRRDGDPHRAGADVVRLADVGDRRQLGHAVALEHRAPDPAGRLFGQVAAERGGARHDPPQAGEVVLLDERVLGQAEDHRRHGEEPADPEVLDEPERLGEVEAGHGHHGAALGQEAVHEDLHAVDVEEREGGEAELALLEAHHRLGLHEVGHQVAVREHHALRQPGRPRRVRAGRRRGSPGRRPTCSRRSP
jgi:hypothetical protein